MRIKKIEKKTNSRSYTLPGFLALVTIVSSCYLFPEVSASTLVVGHRGGDASSAPENTLICITESFSKGVWGHEIDVRTTADGDLVLMHDVTVDRTTNGTGAVTALSTSYIRGLDAGTWKGSAFAREAVPLLNEALVAIKSNGSRAYLDMKDGAASAVRSSVTAAAFDESKLTFLTFSDEQGIEFIAEFPQSETYRSMYGVAYGGSRTDSDLNRIASIGVVGVTIWHGQYTEQYLAAIHAAGLKVAIVGPSVASVSLLEDYLSSGVEELWLDDITSNIADYNNGNGVLDVDLPFKIVGLNVNGSSNQVTIEWNNVRVAHYQVESSSDLKGWAILTSNVAAKSGNTSSYIHEGGTQSHFYRVVTVDE